MSTTLSPSAKRTPKTGAREGTNGTPPTDENSASISNDSSPESPSEETGVSNETTWLVETESGSILKVRVLGKNGRISWSRGSGRGGGEVRVYRTQTSKHYDAVLPDVKKIWSHNVDVEEIGKTKELIAAEETERKLQKKRYEDLLNGVVASALGEEEEPF